ncbi:MAG: flagellar hook-length control protein FliK [Lachnospiraceae bacterium]|nr:flagellar hook-length control protein FliK [Lachnospiraceae bacterium]
MASIPVKDIGAMVGAPYAGGNNATTAGKASGQASFEEVWNGQMGRNAATGNLNTKGNYPGNETAQKPAETKQPEEKRDMKADRTRKADDAGKNDDMRDTREVSKVQDATVEDEVTDDTKKLEEAMEVLGAVAADLIQQVAEHFDVPLEEVQEDMAELGMQPVELLQSDNLSQVLLKVGDAESITDLLTDENLYQDYKAVMAGQEELLQNVEETLQTMEVEPAVEELIQRTVEAAVEPKVIDNPVTEQPEPVIEVEVDEDVEAEREIPRGKEDSDTGEQATTPEPAVHVENTLERVGTGRTGNDGTKHERRGEADSRQVAPTFQNTVSDTIQAQAESTVAEASSTWDVDTQNIMRQIMDYMRVQLKPDMSSLEMQLHPASLGSLQVQVASKGGVLTAQFVTQNESVKAALESQMVQLKESFAEQGVKVDAIEVTVQTHEFERNLNQEQSRQQQDEPARRTRTRRINLNGNLTLEDLESMEEEERLAADMMATNGNSVDYTA